MSRPPTQKDIIDDGEPEDLIVSTDLEDEERFEVIALELANKNARRILREIIKGNNTSTLITEKTGLTIQDVINHLDRLEDIGLVETDGLDTSSLRGRSAKRYRVSKVAVLLIPSQREDEPRLREQLKRKSAMLLRKRLMMSLVASIAWGLIFISVLLESEVQHVRSGFPPNGNVTVTQHAAPIEIITHLSPEIWLVFLALTIASSIGVFFVSRLFAKSLIS